MRILGTILGGLSVLVIAIAIFGLVAALPTMFLWNWLMPELFGLREIGFWQALGLLVLCGFLFKSSGTNSKKD